MPRIAGLVDLVVLRHIKRRDIMADKIPWKYLCECYTMYSSDERIEYINGINSSKERSSEMKKDYEKGCDYSFNWECNVCDGFGDLRPQTNNHAVLDDNLIHCSPNPSG